MAFTPLTPRGGIAVDETAPNAPGCCAALASSLRLFQRCTSLDCALPFNTKPILPPAAVPGCAGRPRFFSVFATASASEEEEKDEEDDEADEERDDDADDDEKEDDELESAPVAPIACM